MTDRSCAVEGCERKYYGRGWCNLHYKRVWKTGSPDPRPAFTPKACSVDGCDRRANVPGSARGYCGPHYQRWQRWGDPLGAYKPVIGIAKCAIKGCDDLVKARNWCVMHYTRWERHGDPLPRFRGEVVDGCRICPRCEVDKPIEQFGKSPAYSLACSADITREYRVRNPYQPVVGWEELCECCGQVFMANKKRSKHCSPACSGESLWKYAAVRRVRILGNTVERFDRLEIFQRDNWMCGICGEPVDPSAERYTYRFPTIDHIIPIARGGEHSRANVQTACLGCNVRKGASVA